MRTMPRLCEFYPGICPTTEEKGRKNLSQGKKNLNQAVRQAVEVYGNAPQWYVIRTLPNL